MPAIALKSGAYNPDTTGSHSTTEIMRSSADGHWTYSILDPPADPHGEWTLTVSELKSGEDFPPAGAFGQTSNAKHLPGPWVFKFMLPVANK